MKKLVVVALVLSIAGFIGFKYYQVNNPEKFAVEQTISTPVSKPSPASVPSESSVHVKVSPPINGTLKGVVEVGASGFNSFVVSIDQNKNWELVSKQFGSSNAYEGFTNTQTVRTGLQNYIADIFNKGVNGRNIHFVISSGAMKNPKTELIAQALTEDGYKVNKVTPQEEGVYALKALLPRDYTNNSFVVDIGSGNTKISWYEGTRLTSIEASGAKYYQDNKSDTDVYGEIMSAVAQVPMSHRENCFIIGGVPFSLAKETRNDNERYTALKNPDFYSAGDDVKKRSGLNIYKALVDGSQCGNFIFDWDANFTIGFLLKLN